jgi:hypothetical protein
LRCSWPSIIILVEAATGIVLALATVRLTANLRASGAVEGLERPAGRLLVLHHAAGDRHTREPAGRRS